MKSFYTLCLLAPSLIQATATTWKASKRPIPGMVVDSFTEWDDVVQARDNKTLEARANPTSYHFEYARGQDNICQGASAYITISGNGASPCHAFEGGDPYSVRWTNPKNPDDPDGHPYWNMILYFHGDSCPVVGHPIQCDTAGQTCLYFTDARPLSYNIVEAASGVTNCDV